MIVDGCGRGLLLPVLMPPNLSSALPDVQVDCVIVGPGSWSLAKTVLVIVIISGVVIIVLIECV